MLTAELKVNGTLISFVYARNTLDRVENQHVYDFEIYRPDDGVIKKGTVQHDRGEGAEELIVKILCHAEDVSDVTGEHRHGAMSPMDLKEGM